LICVYIKSETENTDCHNLIVSGNISEMDIQLLCIHTQSPDLPSHNVWSVYQVFIIHTTLSINSSPWEVWTMTYL
jgi:hypothetical protein